MTPVSRYWIGTIFGLKFWRAVVVLSVIVIVAGFIWGMWEWVWYTFPALHHPGWELTL